jgi:uncharacterized protein (DUF924 family)
MADITPAEIISFWRDAGPERWFKRDAAFDGQIRERFAGLYMAAARRELDGWAETADGALALLLLLDQFPRNMYRGSALAFATDPLARRVAQAAITAGHDQATDPGLRNFFYLPFEHSEAIADQERAVELTGFDPDARKWAIIHRDIIARFGRFPHRNAVLGRDTAPDEAEFLEHGGFSG